jgi:hypothetical protein
MYLGEYFEGGPVTVERQDPGSTDEHESKLKLVVMAVPQPSDSGLYHGIYVGLLRIPIRPNL